MKLDIIVPHYKEPWSTCKYLFDTIATQRGVSLDNIRVIVVNDGDECVLDQDEFAKYPFNIHYIIKKHGGVSDTRNAGLYQSYADYVMFCDIDDGFLSNYGLHLIFSAMQEGFDMLMSNFVEETFLDNDQMSIYRHDRDTTFMHGKVYRRQFLLDNDIVFDPAMTLHEDGYFNSIAYAVANRNNAVKFVDTPFYLWRWNDNSTVRSNRQDFVLRTYTDVILARIGTTSQLKKRGYDEEYKMAIMLTVLNSYYDFQKTSFRSAKNARYMKIAEKAFKGYWTVYGKDFLNCNNQEIADTAVLARSNALKTGLMMEYEDIKSWLKHIEYEVK